MTDDTYWGKAAASAQARMWQDLLRQRQELLVQQQLSQNARLSQVNTWPTITTSTAPCPTTYPSPNPVKPPRLLAETLSDYELVMELIARGYAVAKMRADELAENT
jgi:hypothetical protein